MAVSLREDVVSGPMRRVVIESPYAGEVDKNVAYAIRCVRHCLAKGEAPYASHLFFPREGLLDDAIAEERQLGIEAGLAWSDVADAVVVYVDRGLSEGMRRGIERATSLGFDRSIELRSLETDLVVSVWRDARVGEELARFVFEQIEAFRRLVEAARAFS